MALAAVLLTTNWTSYVYAVVHGRVIETALGYFIAPIGTMLLGVFAMKEQLRNAQRVALVLAVAAVVVLGVAYGQVPVIALLLGTSWCAYGYVKRWVPLAAVESLAGETLVLVVPAAILVAARQNTGSGIFEVGTTTQIVLVLLSAVVTATPLVLFAYAAKRTPFTILGPVGYLVPTINFLLGVLVYHEPMNATRVVGFVLVWIALVILTVDGLR
jgi:chloramphenicol-sensitive protein RarD